jgi:Helix-turn-helix domain
LFLRFRLAAGDGWMCGGSSNGWRLADTSPQGGIAEKTIVFLTIWVEQTRHAERSRLKMRQMTFRNASPARADGRPRRTTRNFETKMSDNNSVVFTLKQTAAYLQISKAHLSNVIKGKVAGIPPLRHAQIGRRILIKREWADEWLESAGQASLL